MRGENKRQLLHISMCLLGLLLRWIPYWVGLICAVIAFLFNLLVLRRIAPGLYRGRERGYFVVGVLSYPAMVFLLILVFRQAYIHLAVAAWAIMAMGDGFSTLVGRPVPFLRLPWNREKSFGGSLAFVVFGTFGAAFYLWFLNPDGTLGVSPLSVPHIWFLAVGTSIICAVVESLRLGIDDNLVVPITAGVVLFVGSLFHFSNLPGQVTLGEGLMGLGLNLALGVAALALGAVNWSGLIGGVIIGWLIFYGLGYSGFILLALFFIIGSAASRHGYDVKQQRGIAQEDRGRRGTKHAVANCLAPVLAGIVAVLLAPPDRQAGDWYYSSLMAVAFLGALGTALSDTVSSELGQVYGKTPILITKLKRVPPGTEGAISLVGTVLGIVAVLVFAFVGTLLPLLDHVPFDKRMFLIPFVVLAATVGNLAESFLGATVEKKGLVGNEMINFLNTVIGGALALVAGLFILPHT